MDGGDLSAPPSPHMKKNAERKEERGNTRDKGREP
jgi:hypothetical protein